VRVINAPCRFASLGAKLNAAVRASRGQILVCSDDDDVSLGLRTAQSVERLAGGHAYYNPQRTYFCTPEALHSDHQHGICHNASAFTREAFEAVGGYPETPGTVEATGAQDAVMDRKLKALGRTAPPLSDDPAEWQFLYMWGRSPHHLSGNADHVGQYEAVGRKPVVPGRWLISPRWTEDYEDLVRRHLAALQLPPALPPP
jgi:hypothetical protein